MYILSLVKRDSNNSKTCKKVELLRLSFTFVVVFVPQTKPCLQHNVTIGGFVRAFSVSTFQ